MKKPDGGPVFPQAHEQRYADPVHGVIRPSDIYGAAALGMSLRDYFAGQALAGMTSRLDADRVRRYFTGHYDGREASVAYVIADTMLAERAK